MRLRCLIITRVYEGGALNVYYSPQVILYEELGLIGGSWLVLILYLSSQMCSKNVVLSVEKCLNTVEFWVL